MTVQEGPPTILLPGFAGMLFVGTPTPPVAGETMDTVDYTMDTTSITMDET